MLGVLDFKEKKVQMIDLATLRATHKENNIYGEPTKGIYHYETIERIANLCRDSGLSYEMKDIFAVQNHSRNTPGVVVLPQVEQLYGENATEAHILRRVFANIEITDGANEETTSNIAIAYHQEGIQVGVGPMVIACQNQTIMHSERMFSNYGKNRMTTEELLAGVGDWLQNFFHYREEDLQRIERMRNTSIEVAEVYKLIGMLTGVRVAKDSRRVKLSPDVYPMTQSQISAFTEEFLLACEKKSSFNLWEIYNIATELYKADKMDVPSVIPQNWAMVEFLESWQG